MKTIAVAPVIAVVICTLLFCARAQNPLTNGLVAYYPFNGDANDLSGDGNNGIVAGDVTDAVTVSA